MFVLYRVKTGDAHQKILSKNTKCVDEDLSF